MFEQALEEFQKEKDTIEEFDSLIESLVGVTYALMDKKENAQQILENLKARSKEMYVAPNNLTLIYYALGDNDQGFEWLEKAYEERDNWMSRLNSDPIFDMVLVDHRSKELLKKMGLE